MENKIHFKKLADIYDVFEFIPKDFFFNKKDFEKMRDRTSKDVYSTFLLTRIPKDIVHERFSEPARLINSYIKSFDLLNGVVNVPISLPDGLVYSSSKSLFDLITKDKKFPVNKYLGEQSIDLPTELDNYYKAVILRRFFMNKGEVFYSELLNIFGVPTVTSDAFTDSKINYYTQLIEENILRKATAEDLPVILKFQTKDQLIETIRKMFSQENRKLNHLSKVELIGIISDRPEITNIELHNNFYFLAKTVQEFKTWLLNLRLYSSVYEMFQADIKNAGVTITWLIKDLIEINNDYVTAFRLSALFETHRQDFINPFGFDIDGIERQKKRLTKYFKNEPLPTIALPNDTRS